jgi:hypothetical protein
MYFFLYKMNLDLILYLFGCMEAKVLRMEAGHSTCSSSYVAQHFVDVQFRNDCDDIHTIRKSERRDTGF